MLAVALDRFGGTNELRLREISRPEPGPTDVLIRVHTAGVGEWDPYEREGGYAKQLGLEPKFPYVLGSEGAGVVAEVGREVRDFREGDQVYAIGFLNPKGGFYAEYAAVPAGLVALVPNGLSPEQAAVVGGIGITALRGLDEVLGVKRGDAVLVFGASGGVGHVAVQLAKRRGARVLAVASGRDGVALAASLGADAAIDGHSEDVAAAAREFAPGGLDAALVTAGGPAADAALTALREGARAAFPNGVEPEPRAPSGVQLLSYDGDPDAQIVAILQRELLARPLRIHVAQVFDIRHTAEAHRALSEHYLGKLAVRVSSGR